VSKCRQKCFSSTANVYSIFALQASKSPCNYGHAFSFAVRCYGLKATG